MIRLERVDLRYDDGSEALRDVSLTLEPGSLHVLTGPSGAGKSSLLRLLYLGRRPSAGRLTFFGRDAEQLSRADVTLIRRAMGVVFQEHRLLDHLTVYENVALPLVVAGEAEARFRGDVLEMLDWVMLRDKLSARPSALSGGERQRVAIARAMVTVPDVILVDEPTGSVDPAMAARIMSLFQEMRTLKRVVLIATHDPRMAASLGAASLRLERGRLIGGAGAERMERAS
ncbi:MAG: ATP-binding cassette domain-containing protein [Pseudomonadota bacterium]